MFSGFADTGAWVWVGGLRKAGEGATLNCDEIFPMAIY